MRRLLLLSFVAALIGAAGWWGIRTFVGKAVTVGEVWQVEFADTFDRDSLGAEWVVSPQTRAQSRVMVQNHVLALENPLYSPYIDLWLTKRFDGPVRIEFDLKVQLKPGGEFGVRMANSQTEILPNTPGYEVYLLSGSTAVIKRADRDEQVSNPADLADEVRNGSRAMHFAAEKDFRKVRVWVDGRLILEYPDPEVLSGKKFDRCGLFLMAGKAEISGLKVSAYPKSSESDMLAQAYEHYTAGSFAQALELYDKFLKEQPVHKRALEARFRKALCYKKLERYTESVTILQALQFNVVDVEYVPDALFFLGEIYQQIKQYDNAAKHYAGFIERFSNHPYMLKSYERLAVCQFAAAKHREALATTDTLLEKYPESITAVHSRFLRGQVHEALNEKSKAAEEYRALLKSVQKDRVANLARAALKRLSAGKAQERAKAVWGKNAVQVTYTPAGQLASSEKMFLHYGVNGWQNVKDIPMTKTGTAWQADATVDAGTRSIEFVFTDGQDRWDNNDGLNWEASAR